MTKNNEQIIIDGVDVNKCRYKNRSIYNTVYCAWCSSLIGEKCTEHPNCYYKQLKRKEQECEKAKQIILQTVKDFNHDYGTPYYDRLLEDAKSLGIKVKDYE